MAIIQAGTIRERQRTAKLWSLALLSALAAALSGCANILATEAASLQAKTASPVFVLTTAASARVSAKGTVSCPDTAAGGSSDLTLTITNSGKTDLSIASAGVTLTMGSGTETGSFSIVSQPSSAIPEGKSATLTLRFSPSALGDKSAAVTIPTNDVDNTSFTFTIKGSCVSGNKDITAFGFVSPPVTGLISGTSIGVNVPVGTNTALLVATFAATGVSVTVNGVVQTSGVTTVDFSRGPVDYVVNAADATTKTYTVTVTVAATPPSLTASPVISAVTSTTASAAGSVSGDGGAAIPAGSRGICWSTSANPTIADSKRADVGGDTGGFTCQLSGLLPETSYYVRAYATNSAGTGYSPAVVFSTAAAPVPTAPTLTAMPVISAVAWTTASGSGNVSSDGGATIPAGSRGICWSTSANPTIADSKQPDAGGGTGGFSCALSGLLPGTYYYVRAYATNSAGTGYGPSVGFSTTAATAPATTAITNINAATAVSGGTTIADSGVTISARGVCWNTTGSPTIADGKTVDGSGAGAFTSSLTGLTYATTYYVRAYATNQGGTLYGPELSLKTVGYIGPSGGYVFYDAGTTQTDATYGNWRYLEAAPGDQGQSAWGDTTTYTSLTGTGIGAGKANTEFLSTFPTTGTAAKICKSQTINGNTGWFLPSRDELDTMMLNLRYYSLGGFQNWYYWSSSEYNTASAYNQVNSGTISIHLKDLSNRYLRAARRYLTP